MIYRPQSQTKPLDLRLLAMYLVKFNNLPLK